MLIWINEPKDIYEPKILLKNLAYFEFRRLKNLVGTGPWLYEEGRNRNG